MSNANYATRKVKGGSVLGNDWELLMRTRIQKSAVVNRLISFFNGEISLEPAQVTVGIHLMRKVLPDVSFTEVKATVTHNVIRAPAVIDNTTEWTNQHVPIEHRSIEDASQEVH